MRTAAGFTNARAPWTFVFPRDHAAHVGFQSEWWYYTGHLRVADGRRFGYELTFFRYGLRPGDPRPARGQSAWRGNQVFPAHLALTDESGKRFVHDEQFAREALGMGRASATRLDMDVNTWTLRARAVPGASGASGAARGVTDPTSAIGAASRERTAHARSGPSSSEFVLHAAADEVALDLVQMPVKPPAVHGHDGISLKAACSTCASHYYSMTRLRTAGTLVYRGERLRVVDGLSWMDHEFGSEELQRDQAGWDWFALQLDDGRDIMDYRLRQKDGSLTAESSGSLVDLRGRVQYLARSDVVVGVTGSWKSPRTGGVYPSGWTMEVPRAGLALTLTPTVLDQELANTPGGVSYWEGSVDVTDTRTGKHVGIGYVELTGYAGAVSL